MKLEEILRLKRALFLSVFLTLMSSIYYVFHIIYDMGVFFSNGRLTQFDLFFFLAIFSTIACVSLFSRHKNQLSEFADFWIKENESKVKEKMIFHLRLLMTYFAVLSLVLFLTILTNEYHLSAAIFTSVSLVAFVGFFASQKKLREEISFSRVSVLKSIVMVQIPISKYQEAGVYDKEADIFDLDISEKKQNTNNTAERNSEQLRRPESLT